MVIYKRIYKKSKRRWYAMKQPARGYVASAAKTVIEG
jgi:hypothetical protein